MPKKKRKFIDKRNAITYHLIHRSQKDPLQADEEAPQRVLMTNDELSNAKKKERLATLGIYYDDDYDYEQHLRDVEAVNTVEPSIDLELIRVGSPAKSKIALPNEVLPSTKEEKVGMLELAAPVSGPRLDWDPDIVAALDSDNDEPMDDDFDDDFITMANQEPDGEEEAEQQDDWKSRWLAEQMATGPSADAIHHGDISSDFSGDDLSDDELEDDVGSMPSFSDDDDAKTRFTNYSMSSSVIRRNQGLTLVDEKFEQLFAEYDDDEIGALDQEEIDGKVSTDGPMMQFLLKQFEKQKIGQQLPEPEDQKDMIEICSDAESSDNDGDDDVKLTKVVIDEGQKWDCESILSTYSNLYNHPRVIEDTWKKPKKIELTKKLGIPVESLPARGLTKKQLKQLNAMDGNESEETTPVRRKGESAEEKKARKAAVKLDRKERRVEKKNTKVAFRQEEANQKRQQIAAKSNLQANKIL